MRSFTIGVLALVAGAVLVQPARGVPLLAGRVEGHVYYPPSGIYHIAVPVLPELGGTINDTENVVTFQDQFNLHVSIGAFPMDATQRWELATRGRKDYLVYFFNNFVLADFRRLFPDTRIESARFVPGVMSGALVTYTLMPGGSMFSNRNAVLGLNTDQPVAKRGNLIFVRNGYIYIISTELAERVTERSTYHKTTEEEDAILRQRLSDFLEKLQFSQPANDS
jgi:hypothetical protein